jgi:hypothetical protein
MKLLGIEHTLREAIYLFLILILAIGFFLMSYAQEQTVKEYTDAYHECMYSRYMCEHGQLPTWNEKEINVTLKIFNQE